MELKEPKNLKRSQNSEKKFIAVQLNCNGLINKLAEIKVFIYTQKPDIICLSETYIKKHEPKFIGYHTYWKHREGHKGGLAMIVRRDIIANPEELTPYPQGNLELQHMKIFIGSRSIGVINAYNPNKTIHYEELLHYKKQITTNMIIMGDFNGHSPMWDSRGRSNRTGKTIEEILTNSDLVLLNTPENPTYLDYKHHTSSCLDLCIASRSLAIGSTLEVAEDLGSDHFPVICNFNLDINKDTEKIMKNWKYSSANWKEFRTELEDNMKQKSIYLPADTEAMNLFITKSIYTAAEKAIGRTSGKKTLRRCVYGWDEECSKAAKNRKQLRNKLAKHPNIRNLILWKEARAKARYILKTKKQESFKKFVDDIDCNTPSKIVWRKIKSINGTISNKTNFLGPPTCNDKEIADLFVDHFTRFDKPLADDEIGEKVNQIKETPLNDGEIPPITKKEVESAIKKLKNTSAGEDQISNRLLKHVPQYTLESFVTLFNISLCSSHLPLTWKVGITCPIPKTGKKAEEIPSSRPITMLSCMGKLMERVIQSRLEHFLETRNKFNEGQIGFRQGMGTTEALAMVHSEILKSFSQKSYTIIVYLDLQSAFDSVWHTGLLYKAQELQIPKYLLKWLYNYLSDRKIKVRYKNTYSKEKTLDVGLPQGAVLSPILFNIMLYDIPTCDKIKTVIYADDITLISTGNDIGKVRDQMQSYLKGIESWLKKWKLSVNPQKSVFQIFTKKRNIPNITIKLYKQNLRLVTEQRVLGMIFDSPKMTFNNHISYITKDCQRRMHVIRALSSSKWGCSRTLLRRIYVAYIRSKLEYGAILLLDINKTNKQKLEKIQNDAMRCLLGARKTSPIQSLQVESYLPPVELRFKQIYVKWCIKTTSNFNLQKLFNLDAKKGKNPHSIKLQQTLEDMQLELPQRNLSNTFSASEPWHNLDKQISHEFPKSNLSSTSFEQYLKENYKEHIPIYTDGSKHKNGSTASAIYAPFINKVKTFKLIPQHSVVGSELFAIKKALDFIQETNPQCNYIILTDSLSSLQIIANIHKAPYREITKEIQKVLLNRDNVRLQWIPSHSGIKGNEVADKAANLGHKNNRYTKSELETEELLESLYSKFKSYWHSHWRNSIISSQKGKFMADKQDQIRSNHWITLSSRRVETAITRFRIGHVGVKSHLNRFELADSDMCYNCGQPETIEHLILRCPKYQTQRRSLQQSHTQLNIDFTLKNILCFGNQDTRTLEKLLVALATFLKGTDRISEF